MKIIAFIILFLYACLQPAGLKIDEIQVTLTWTGTASFYHQKFEGRKTSSGEVFSNKEYTAAHKSLPFGTYVKVTHLKNEKQVLVKINDRLPPKSTRMIDLSVAAATDLNMIRAGLAKVQIEVVMMEEEEAEENE
ncbi:MAG: septal ring lytic transglycosylase RlpA family protein [Bacteroidetes bacterium]|nr:septal ring lytic transglycosylase RlpA family protein [Bacteroidota bacterium]